MVVLAGRRPDALASVAERGTELPGVLDPAPTDVTDEASVRALVAATRQAFGRLDLLFNNAGRNQPEAPIDDLPLEQWRAAKSAASEASPAIMARCQSPDRC